MRLRIIIAGAGLGGLAVAANLLEAGHDVTVYEKSTCLGEIGAGIQLSANATHVLDALGLGEAIEEVGVRPREYVFRFYNTGEIIERFPLAQVHERMHGAPYIHIHRADLHELLLIKVLKLKPDALKLGRCASGFEEFDDRVELEFNDGSRVSGDLLIGADGLKSVVRRQITGAVEAVYTGDSAWRLTVPVTRLPKDFMEPVMTVVMGPGKHAVMYYVRSRELLNLVAIVETDDVQGESWTGKFPWLNLKKDFSGWHEIVQTVIDAADKDFCYRWSLFVRPPISRWGTQRVTILGDAAHPTLPYLAQGACAAIEDGAILRRSLDMKSSISEAIDLYQCNRVDRTHRIMEQSQLNRKLFHLNTIAEFRDAFGKRDVGGDRNKWLYSYNPLTVSLA